jgi:C4-dicarboxylate-specific signal transduction histidine kinase
MKTPAGVLQLDIRVRGLMVFWNRLELELCLRNVIKNALEANADNRQARILVVLAAEDAGTKAVISVLDNAPTDQEALAVHSRPLNTSKTSGTGLGLLIVRTLCEKAAGNFLIRRSGELTEARITLPVAKEQEHA